MKGIEITGPPIHTHWNEGAQREDLCGRVVCPYGFVGIKIKENNGRCEEWKKDIPEILTRKKGDQLYTAMLLRDGKIKYTPHPQEEEMIKCKHIWFASQWEIGEYDCGEWQPHCTQHVIEVMCQKCLERKEIKFND